MLELCEGGSLEEIYQGIARSHIANLHTLELQAAFREDEIKIILKEIVQVYLICI